MGKMHIQEYGDPKASIVLIQMVDDHDLELMEKEVAAIEAATSFPFRLITIKVNHWNDDLSPWGCQPVFGNVPFAGKAEKTMQEVLLLTENKDKTYLIGGYSLSGLFALWIEGRTDRFVGVAAASPSIWFPDFIPYMRENPLRAEHIYLSLGDREERSKNPLMSKVALRIREAEVLLQEEGKNCILEWNEGNHFKNPDLRTARAFAWTIEETQKKEK